MTNRLIRCRICDELVPSGSLEVHSNLCASLSKLELELEKCDERLKKLQQDVQDVLSQISKNHQKLDESRKDFKMLQDAQELVNLYASGFFTLTHSFIHFKIFFLFFFLSINRGLSYCNTETLYEARKIASFSRSYLNDHTLPENGEENSNPKFRQLAQHVLKEVEFSFFIFFFFFFFFFFFSSYL